MEDIDVDLRHLRYFVAVAEELHFSNAAARLGVSEPPLSKQISDLEREVGTPLLRRTSRRVELTPAGEVFLLEAQARLRSADEAMEAARRTGTGQVGRLTVGVLSVATCWYTPEAARRFREGSPSVELYLEELPRSFAEHARALLTRKVDLAIVRLHPAAPDVSSEVVADEAMVAVLPADHDLARRDCVPLHELLAQPFISSDPGEEATQIYMDQVIGGQPAVLVVANVGTITLLGLVAEGLGVCLLPESVQAVQRAAVVYRPVHPVPHLPVRVAWRTSDLSAPAAEFLEIFRDVARPLPS